MEFMVKGTKADAPSRQRSAVPIPIAVSSVDSEGRPFKEDSRTLVITRHGMMIETIHHVNLGTEFTVENPALGRSSTGRVVWCGGAQSGSHVSEVGIYLPNAEYVCGIELDAEPARSSTPGSDNMAIVTPALNVPSEARATHGLASEPASPASTSPPETVDPTAGPAWEAAHTVERALAPEFDLTTEVGRIGTGLSGPQVIGESAARSDKLGAAMLPALESVHSAEVATPVFQLFPEQLRVTVEHALELVEERIQQTVPLRAKLFEEQLDGLAQRAVEQFQSGLEAFAQKSATDLEQAVASVGERLGGARAEVEVLVDRLKELSQQTRASLEETATRQEKEWATGLEERMVEARAQQVAALEGHAQSSRAEVEQLLARVEESRQQTCVSLQESATRLEQETTVRLEQHVSALNERLQKSSAEAEGLLTRLADQRQQLEAQFPEIGTTFEQQLSPLKDRLQGMRAEIEGWITRLDELRRQTHDSLQESMARMENDAAARLEQAARLILEQQMAPTADRLRAAQTELEGLLARLEEARQQAEGSLQGVIARCEEQSASRLEQRIQARLDNARQELQQSATQWEEKLAAVVDVQVAAASKRFEDSRLQAEGIVAKLEEAQQRVQASFDHSMAQAEEKMAACAGQHLTAAEERLQGSRAEAEAVLVRLEGFLRQANTDLEQGVNRLQTSRSEVETMLAGFEEARRQAHTGLEELAGRLGQNMTASFGQHLEAAANRFETSRNELETMLAGFEGARRQAHSALEELAGQLGQNMTSSLSQHLEAAVNRFETSRSEVETMLAGFEEARRQAHTGLDDLADQLRQRLTACAEQNAVSVGERLAGARAEVDTLLIKVVDLQQASQSEIEKARTALKELGSQTVELALAGVNERLDGESANMLSQFRGRSEAIAESECYALSQRLSSAGDFIRDWSQQAATRLSSHGEKVEARTAASIESLQRQSDEISAALVDKLRDRASAVLGDALERVEQTARLFENTTVEAAQQSVRKGTRELVDTTAEELRRLAQENLDLVSQHLAERQQQFTNDMSKALSQTLQELVEASSAKLQQLTDNGLERIAQELAERQTRLINDTTSAFRHKISEILVNLQGGSAGGS